MTKRTKHIIALVSIVWLLLIAHTVYKVVDERKPKDESPHIYHLVDDEYDKVFVYPTFKDKHQYIKYLFDFANKQNKNVMVIKDKDDYITDDIPYFFERNSTYKDPYFYFNKCDSSYINYTWITVLLNSHKINFDKSNISDQTHIGTKLKVESDSLDRNIMQNFVSYRVYDSTAEKVNKTYIYELYSKSDSLWARKTFHDYGKYFSIDVY